MTFVPPGERFAQETHNIIHRLLISFVKTMIPPTCAEARTHDSRFHGGVQFYRRGILGDFLGRGIEVTRTGPEVTIGAFLTIWGGLAIINSDLPSVRR
jgi:hypothetical protein